MTTSSPRSASLSVIIPCFNEADSLPETIPALLDALRAEDELILVDDASEDATAEVIARWEGRDGRVRGLRLERNLGQSGAFLRGFAEARGELLCWNGADLHFAPGDIPRVREALEGGLELAVIERRDRGAYGLRRKLLSWANAALLRGLFGSPFSDHNFVFFIRRALFERIPVRTRGVSSVAAEIIIRAHRAGRQVAAIDADYQGRARGRSSITLGRILHTTYETLRLRLILHRDALSAPTSASPKRAGEKASR